MVASYLLQAELEGSKLLLLLLFVVRHSAKFGGHCGD